MGSPDGQRERRGRRAAALLALLAACLGSAACVRGDIEADSLPLGEARLYMLGLVNRDRAAAGLQPVALDEVATRAAQIHADEMAVNQYMAHYDMAGRTPDQRYTEAGGTGLVQENAYVQSRRRGESAAGALSLAAAPAFTRRELEEIEAAYFNEVPPHDAHRRNILDPMHTHVGVGLARANGVGVQTLANTQEFVNRYLQLDPLPARVEAGGVVRVRGTAAAGMAVRSITVARAPLPVPMTPTQLDRTRGYAPPRASATFWPKEGAAAGAGFSLSVTLPDRGRPGLYFISVWVTPASGPAFVASRRTVLVDDGTASPAQPREGGSQSRDRS